MKGQRGEKKGPRDGMEKRKMRPPSRPRWNAADEGKLGRMDDGMDGASNCDELMDWS